MIEKLMMFFVWISILAFLGIAGMVGGLLLIEIWQQAMGLIPDSPALVVLYGLLFIMSVSGTIAIILSFIDQKRRSRRSDWP